MRNSTKHNICAAYNYWHLKINRKDTASECLKEDKNQFYNLGGQLFSCWAERIVEICV